MSEETDLSPQTVVADIVAIADNNSRLHTAVMESFVFQGKSLSEWLDSCAVEIPNKMTPEEYRQVAALLARKIQQAMHFYTMCSTTTQVLDAGNDKRKNEIVNALVNTYQASDAKRPAAKVLERMASDKLASSATHELAARLLKEFWRDRRDALIETRKLLETIGMSANIEIKYLEATTGT
jgi:hypothetical protein